MSNFITAGELAKLAGTTKRTIHFYDQKGILKPKKINSQNYRFYDQRQVLDYQMILLLSTLGVSLKEIKMYLKKSGKLPDLFRSKTQSIQHQINQLQFNLNHLNNYLTNLTTNGTLVHPVIKTLAPIGVYYFEKTCSYAQIGAYCQELSQMFKNKGKNFTTLAIFDNPTYQPQQSHIKIGVLASPDMQIKDEYKKSLQYLKFNPGKVITYTHHGSGSLLSLFWKELEKYCRLNKIKVRTNTPDFEIYRSVNNDVTQQFFEIYLPIY